MTPAVYAKWKRISNTAISSDGDHVLYRLTREVGDDTLKIYHTRTGQTAVFPRATSPTFDASGDYVAFKLVAHYDTIRQLKFQKKKKDEMQDDTLAIYNLRNQEIDRIASVKEFSSPEKWGSLVVAQLNPSKKDTTLVKKENEKNGSKLLIIDLRRGYRDTIHYVTGYKLSEEGEGLAYISTGSDTINHTGVYYWDFEERTHRELWQSKGKYSNLSFSEDGTHLSFLADMDTTDAEIRTYSLFLADTDGKAKEVISPESDIIEDGWMISPDRNLRFSADNSRLFFGLKQVPPQPDTTLLDE